MHGNPNVFFYFSWKWSIYENCSNELRITFLYNNNVRWCRGWVCHHSLVRQGFCTPGDRECGLTFGNYSHSNNQGAWKGRLVVRPVHMFPHGSRAFPFGSRGAQLVYLGMERSDQMKPRTHAFHLSPIQTCFTEGARLWTSFNTNPFSSSLFIFTSSPPSPLQYAWAWCQDLIELLTK